MNKVRTAALLSLAVALAACSDSSVAPPSQPARAIKATGGGASASLSGWDTLRFSFVIDPSRNITYPLGAGNSITFPAGSLCDPATSSYGPGTWDQPCTAATSPLTENAKAWLDANGHPHIDFSPSIRFVPTANPAGWVVISFTDSRAALNPLSTIQYCASPTSTCVNEALTDPTLATVANPVTGQLTRRVKHFSGYNVAAGVDCSATPYDPSCSGVGISLSFSMSRAGGSSVGQPGNSSQQRVTPLLRQHQLPDHPTRSADIGPDGGELSLPQAGLTVVVPPGAVSQVTHFSVTAVAGSVVAYEFEPHGTHFNVPLLFRQQLRGTNHRSGDLVQGAYFADPSQLGTSSAFVDELLDTSVDLGTNEATFAIHHFSGYMLASGRGGGGN